MPSEILNCSKKIGIIGTQSSTMNCINSLIRAGYVINNLITLPPHLNKDVADYQDLSSFAKAKDIPLTLVGSYTMKDEVTIAELIDKKMDIVIVVGWQRLIAGWFLEKPPLGVYGMHGSSKPLPKGRGRSPMNWSIIEQRDRFYTHLFRYNAEVDSGAIVDTQRFDIYPWDTIQSLQHKNTVSQCRLLIKNLPSLLKGKAVLIPQNDAIKPSYYPKRNYEDGSINWMEWSAREIYDLIRSVTKPYPGAFTRVGSNTVKIWRAIPFDSNIEYPESKPGEILEVFTDNSFVVKCFVDTLLVLEYESESGWEPIVGGLLESLVNNSWIKLAQMRIDERSHAE